MLRKNTFVRYACLAWAGFAVAACNTEDIEDAVTVPGTSPRALVSGDIVVTNGGSDTVLALTSTGAYFDVVLDVDNTQETVWGIGWQASTREVIIPVDGSDRITAVSGDNLDSKRELYLGGGLNGLLKGMTILSTGEILVLEDASGATSIEKFTSAGVRQGNPFVAAASTLNTTLGISARPGGGFTICAAGSADRIRNYTAAGVAESPVQEATSGIGGTTDSGGCLGLADGRIAALWQGTADALQIRSANLSTVSCTYQDQSVMQNPQGLGQRANGNILISDGVFHHIVEVTSSCTFVQVIGSSVLNSPRDMIVIP